jgi:hypothetical protein
MDDHARILDDVTTRTARCGVCGRPVWAGARAAGEQPPPPPELCDYCAAAGGRLRPGRAVH